MNSFSGGNVEYDGGLGNHCSVNCALLAAFSCSGGFDSDGDELGRRDACGVHEQRERHGCPYLFCCQDGSRGLRARLSGSSSGRHDVRWESGMRNVG